MEAPQRSKKQHQKKTQQKQKQTKKPPTTTKPNKKRKKPKKPNKKNPNSGFTNNELCCAGTIPGAWIMFCSIQLHCDRDILWPWTSGSHGQIPCMMKQV